MNRLSNEKSPYLLQHKNNPVDWYPWSKEAFERAKNEDKPVFLSIGYATCHWCHVMEHESFEDEEVAGLMNEAFISIKVDREERPDIDNTYMTVCQMLTGQGGWPLTIVMTPDKEPFFAATYLPKHSRQNRPGMLDMIPQISSIWKNDRDRINQSVQKIKEGFTKSLQLGRSGNDLNKNIIKNTRDSLSSRFDPIEGGFGSSPKFPSPHNLLFLVNYHRQFNDPKALEMANLTLKKMRLGGLWDHVGKGFHRYSTDHEWLLPHFEKMLYDQATLLMAYSEGWLESGESLFKETVFDIVSYLDECLTSDSGAFYSAEDADSEGEEGKFYVWTKQEINDLLEPDDAEIFCDLFNIENEGNFRDEATHEKTGKNIPHLRKPIVAEASDRGLNPGELEEKVQRMINTLHEERKKRVRPLLDDKILTDWNGLMIAALARAGVVFDNTEFISRAENAWSVLKKHCFKEDGRLLHRLKDGEAEIEGMADDYAFTVWGLVELYRATFNPDYLEYAVTTQEYVDRHFLDKESGGYYFTSEQAEKLLGRQKEIYDGAMPSSNSVFARNGYFLSRLTGNPEYENRSLQLLQAFSDQLNDAPAGYSFAIDAFQLMESEGVEIVITALNYDEFVQDIVSVCRELAPAQSAILVKTAGNSVQLNSISHFVKNYPFGEKPAVYICKNFECSAPVHNISDIKNELLNI